MSSGPRKQLPALLIPVLDHFWTNFFLSSVNTSPSAFPGCGIPHSPFFGSTDVVPGMKDNRIVPPVTIVQSSLSPSLGDGCEIC